MKVQQVCVRGSLVKCISTEGPGIFRAKCCLPMRQQQPVTARSTEVYTVLPQPYTHGIPSPYAFAPTFPLQHFALHATAFSYTHHLTTQFSRTYG